jgi:hypothetical protein
MHRVVEPELLDELPPADPRAVGSRADLRRLNFIMGHTGILSRAFQHQVEATAFRTRPLRLVELGAGDGTLLLRLARRSAAVVASAEVTLLDRQDLVSAKTRRAFAALNWSIESATADALSWLKQSAPDVELMIANLFLHHFPDELLRVLLQWVAAKTNLFIACEPQRSPLALEASRWVRLIGCNSITRHDAVRSVRAGFFGRELSALWPADNQWQLTEQPAGFFSHCFIAKRRA